MKKKYGSAAGKRTVLLCLLLGMLLPVLSGCSAQPAAQEGTQLWVVTEQTTWDRMNGLAYVLIEEFEQAHQGVSVRLDILPTEQQERSVYLQRLRTQIMEGGGPDAYLLPTDGSLILDEPVQYTYLDVDLLFEDVELAMRNGLFYDISDLYEQDDTLGKEALYTQIMDAGLVGDARYVLPLRFDMPVVFGDTQALKDAGLNPEILEQGIGEMMDAVTELDNPVLALGTLYDSYNAFGDLIDYESGEVLLDQQTLAAHLERYQQLREKIGFDAVYYNSLESYDQFLELIDRGAVLVEKLDLSSYIYGLYDTPISVVVPDSEEEKSMEQILLPLYIGTMKDVLEYAPKARYEEKELTMLPLRATNGDAVATVTYYAAVGSGCEEPALAYAFLRLFLLEESQWELNRPERSHIVGEKGRPLNTSNSLQYPGMIEAGWPVRVKGSVEHMWQIRRMQIYNTSTSGETKLRMRGICLSELEEEQIPVLTADIDQVRFNTELSESLTQAISSLNDPGAEFAVADVDIGQMAEELLWELRWHASEG